MNFAKEFLNAQESSVGKERLFSEIGKIQSVSKILKPTFKGDNVFKINIFCTGIKHRNQIFLTKSEVFSLKSEPKFSSTFKIFIVLIVLYEM